MTDPDDLVSPAARDAGAPARVLRVAVASPQPVVANGLRSMLRAHPDRFAVVPLPDGPDHPDPDVVLYDVVDLVDGHEQVLKHLVANTCAKVLAVGRELRPDLVARALQLGADGFFPMAVGDDELVAAVASAGTSWSPGDPGESPIVGASGKEARQARAGAEVGLTDREADVVRMIASGLSNEEIADELGLSINTVKTNIRTAYRRMGVETRSQAAVWAVQRGLSYDGL